MCNLINTHTHTHTHERRPYSATLYPISFTALTLSLPSRFVPSARLTVGGTPCALWLVGRFSCDHMFGEERGGGRTRQTVGPPVDTVTMTAVMSANRVDLESFSSRCWTFRRTHTSANPVRVLCIQLALHLTLSLPSRLAPSARLTVGVPPRALWLAGIFYVEKKYVRV